ncbi:DUF397 domain-containing protein [Streptomyces phyllanthi]|uniref:DUF397 domain-containing protein n=1 Tax=Streptomyces phyllanthi TaxID=1803180 RepID=A0A5N8W1J4_9ACTN|nr:DUF397 domain-containing protein [Streptomyces phyllanthi]MPY41381.1 DUF397 domain-containing protein [Streptomyces phyllanthi]
MSQLAWQKSSFSEPGGDTCVELASDPAGRAHLRESDEPGTVVETTATALGALLRAVRDGSADAAQG